MAATGERAKVAPGTISFELERFERSDGRLELSGRWYGVRGLRFVRPMLTLGFADDSSARALADLEHKPWAPEDGETWQAAFPCAEDAKPLDVELAVAPGIAIQLPAPGEELPSADPIAALAPGSPPEQLGGRSAPAPRRPRGAQRSEMPDELAALRHETQRLRQEPIRLQAELDQSEELRKEVEGELDRLKMDADGAIARRDAAVDRYDEVTAERDEAIRERNAAVLERDAAARARDEAVAGRDAAQAEAKTATSERDAAMSARDAAISERDEAVSKCEKATEERGKALAERDKAISERDRALAQRSLAASTRVLPPPRPALAAPIFSDDHDQLIKRAAAIALLAVAGLALLIILGVF